jgi:hypothetical protein
MSAGILRSPCLFFTWFACSVLEVLESRKKGVWEI